MALTCVSLDIPLTPPQNASMLRFFHSLSFRLSNLERAQRTWVAASLIYFFVVLAVVVAYIPTEARICAVWADEVELIFKSAGKDDDQVGFLVAKRGEVGDIAFARDAMLVTKNVVDKHGAASEAAAKKAAGIGEAPEGIAYNARLKAADEAIELAKKNWDAALNYANTHDSVGASLAQSQAHLRLLDMEKHREWLDKEMPGAMQHYFNEADASLALGDVGVHVLEDLFPLRKRHNAELAVLPKTQLLYGVAGFFAWALPQAALYFLLCLFRWVRRGPRQPG